MVMQNKAFFIRAKKQPIICMQKNISKINNVYANKKIVNSENWTLN